MNGPRLPPSEVGDAPSDGVATLSPPRGATLPLVFDSPHSGRTRPPDFHPACPPGALRQAEDAHVDRLVAGAVAHGATLLTANFPRAYIDPNRAEDDLDPHLLADPWPGPVTLSDKGRVGMGLVRRICRPGLPMYDRRLTVAEVEARIERYYRPYHARLAALLDGLRAGFGEVWLLDMHSMPSAAGTLARGRAGFRADFVLGDRDGTTCAPAFTRHVAACLRAMGYGVALNDPYKGVEIVRRHGRPAEGRHALQIEINRRLYMDEATLEPHAGFAPLAADLSRLAGEIAAFVSARLLAAAAD